MSFQMKEKNHWMRMMRNGLTKMTTKTKKKKMMTMMIMMMKKNKKKMMMKMKMIVLMELPMRMEARGQWRGLVCR